MGTKSKHFTRPRLLEHGRRFRVAMSHGYRVLLGCGLFRAFVFRLYSCFTFVFGDVDISRMCGCSSCFPCCTESTTCIAARLAQGMGVIMSETATTKQVHKKMEPHIIGQVLVEASWRRQTVSELGKVYF